MEKFLRVLDTKPPEFFARYVRSISFGNQATTKEMERILSVCTGVVDLCTGSKNQIHLDSSEALSELLHPRRMSLEIGILQGLPDRPTNFAHPIFSQVTHLELDDGIDVWSTFAFELLPCLTHLGVSTWGVHEWDSRRLESMRRILIRCRLLKVLWVEVIMEWPCFDESHLRSVMDDIGEDPRVVIFSSDDEDFVRLSGFVVAEKTAMKQALLDGREHLISSLTGLNIS